jgi:hypothetical protein
MTILFMGGEMGAFIPSGGGVSESTTGFRYNGNFARTAMNCDGNTSTPDAEYGESSSWANQTGPVFVHYEEVSAGVAATTHSLLGLINGSGTEVFRIRQAFVNSDTRTLQMQYLDGSAVWTNAGSAVQQTTTRIDFDFYVNIDSDEIGFFASATEKVFVTGLSLGHLSGVTKLRCYSDAQGRFWSQVLVSTETTIGGRLFTVPVSGAGATSQWTGAVANIDEATYNDADFINSNTADQVSVFAATTPDLTGYAVRAVAVTARAKRGGSGPQKLRHALRSSGTNYFSGSDIALGLGYSATCTIWEDDPATASPFSISAIANLQPGVKSIA